MGALTNILAFIIVIGIIILIHELGHFTVAKLNGMYVYQFCIGLGPKLLKYQGKETLYSICLFPVGGMVDLREDEEDSENTRSFSAKKPYQRLLVILAGVFMNFVLAFILILGLNFNKELPTTVVAEAINGYPAYEAGIKVGDQIISVNNEKVSSWNDIQKNILFSGKKEFNIKVLRGAVEKNITVRGKVDGPYVKIGIKPELKRGFFYSMKYSSEDFLSKSTLIFDGFKRLILGKISPKEISGPVGIYKQVGEVAKTNIKNLIYFTALLSINLGIFNLLPFPFLDGGRAVFIIYEMIAGHPVKKEREAFVHFIGMLVLLILTIVLVFKDLWM